MEHSDAPPICVSPSVQSREPQSGDRPNMASKVPPSGNLYCDNPYLTRSPSYPERLYTHQTIPETQTQPLESAFIRAIKESGIKSVCDSFRDSGVGQTHSGVVLRDRSTSSKGRWKKKQGKRRSYCEGSEQSDFDDSASVCSDHSSISSSSVKSSGTLKKKKVKKTCPIHSKKIRESSVGVGEGVPEGEARKDDSRENLECTCSKKCPIHSRKAREAREANPDSFSTEKMVCTCSKSKKKRPEPEGGPRIGPLIIQDEYDKIIWNNDPIFSDLEDDPAIDEKVRADAERHHKRNQQNNIFSAAQMVNTNTMMKFAIIGAELQNSVMALRRAEGDVAALTRRIRLLEEDYEATEGRLNNASEKLEEASKAADESERARRAHENMQSLHEDRIQMLEQMVKEATEAANEAERKYDEVARKLLMTEADLERSEERADLAERKIKEMEEELHVVTNNLRSLEISEDKASQREDSYEESIRDLTQRLKDAENRAAEAERTVSKLQKEVDRLEEELLDEKLKYKALREEMDVCFQELQGM